MTAQTSTPTSALVDDRTSVLSRRSVLVGVLGVAGAGLVGVPAAEAVSIGSRVKDTYVLAGGRAVLGAAKHKQVKRKISGVSTYGQEFEHGSVWWTAGTVGKVDLPESRVRLDSAPNFRPVVGVSDLWRSDDLDGCTPLEERIVIDLGIETMIAMNSGSDPSIPGVDRHKYKISNTGDQLDFYRDYVSLAASRESVGRVLRRVARSDGGVIVHCTAGKDRTGWVCDLMQTVAGVSLRERDEDYLATRWYSGDEVDLAWLTAAREQLVIEYGTLTNYLVSGCGLDPKYLTRLKKRIA